MGKLSVVLNLFLNYIFTLKIRLWVYYIIAKVAASESWPLFSSVEICSEVPA